MQNEFLLKKAYFQCARRAMLENETIMVTFADKIVKNHYSDEKLERLNNLLTHMNDNDMFDMLMGKKTPEDFKNLYDFEISTEIFNFSASLRTTTHDGDKFSS